MLNLFMSVMSVLMLVNSLEGSLLPDFDKRCNSMSVCHAEVSPHKYVEHEGYFNKHIPNKIHQIWFGDVQKMPKIASSWASYCIDFGYEYDMWKEEDLERASSFVSPKNMEHIHHLLSIKQYWAASDILRFEILKEYGGIYIDCDFKPPLHNQEWVDLREISPMKGLTVVTEHNSRNVGESGLFVMNGFIMAAPGHPVIISMTEQFDKNITSWNTKEGNYDAMFITGPFMFNRVLFGSFNVIPITYFQYFKMY